MTVTRGSLASFVSYPHRDKELLILNKNQLSKGSVVYSPVGGVISLTTEEAVVFCGRTGLDLSDFGSQKSEGVYDLRFTSDHLNPQAIRDEFPQWGGQHRPGTAHRELVEELVDELHILDEHILRPYTLHYLHTSEEIAPSDRAGGALTLRIASVFRLRTGQAAYTRIMLAASNREPYGVPLACFASRPEIEAGINHRGVAIASVSRLLLP